MVIEICNYGVNNNNENFQGTYLDGFVVVDTRDYDFMCIMKIPYILSSKMIDGQVHGNILGHYVHLYSHNWGVFTVYTGNHNRTKICYRNLIV